MPSQLAHDAVALVFAMVLHRTADVAKMSSRNCVLNAQIERRLRRAEEFLHLITDLAYTECIARVTIESVKQCAAIDGDDVSLLQHRLRARNAVHHHLVDRGADAGRKRRTIGIRKSLERRHRTVVANELVGNAVQLERRHSWLDMFSQFAKRFTNKLVRLAHQLNFIFSLQKYLHPNEP